MPACRRATDISLCLLCGRVWGAQRMYVLCPPSSNKAQQQIACCGHRYVDSAAACCLPFVCIAAACCLPFVTLQGYAGIQAQNIPLSWRACCYNVVFASRLDPTANCTRSPVIARHRSACDSQGGALISLHACMHRVTVHHFRGKQEETEGRCTAAG